MPTYMTSFVYNGEGWQKLAKNPEDRSIPVKALMEKLGGRLISMYYMAGDYDGFIIYEAPDAKVAATAVVAVGLAGHIRTLKTSQLYTVAEATEVMGNAGKLAYPAPKG
ncbi:GYD domain-containing protein [Polaromonas sp.]|uniref:GYD domain-containing protein n=1 Tax=Polaromonas sp. TaxID=1869339 RepID=UPI00286B5A6A|nr:GYD domain-containing protein [Polaromonas sp.]